MEFTTFATEPTALVGKPPVSENVIFKNLYFLTLINKKFSFRKTPIVLAARLNRNNRRNFYLSPYIRIPNLSETFLLMWEGILVHLPQAATNLFGDMWQVTNMPPECTLSWFVGVLDSVPVRPEWKFSIYFKVLFHKERTTISASASFQSKW